jgi:arylsulfatase A-like enzyme
MLSAMDENAGKVLAKLRDEKLEERTLIVFFSDNGGPTMQGTTINGSVNAPLRGSKRTTLEGGVRVPFVFTWKGTLPAGKVYENPVIQLDLMPTFLAAADVAAKTDWKFDGVDLLPYLRGENPAPPHDALYWRSGGEWAIRAGDWKLVRTNERGKDAAGNDPGPRTRQKLSVEGAQLYNLRDDVGETNDLAASNPAKAKELAAAWQTWSGQMKQPLWGPPDRSKSRGGKAAKREAE